MSTAGNRIYRLSLPDTPEGPLARERVAALADLLRASHFRPCNDGDGGPYALALSVEEGRLVLRIGTALRDDLAVLGLSFSPYRALIRDYFLMIESYEKARHDATHEKLEAIDMGRRGLHDEGAMLLMTRLKDKVEMDHDTARRLFTLICTLENRGALRVFGN